MNNATQLLCGGLFLLLASAPTANAQTISAATPGGPVAIPAHNTTVVFLASNGNSMEEALKNATIEAGEAQVIGAVAAKTLPIPIIGSLPIDGLLKVFGKKKTIKGFYMAYLPNLSAEARVETGTPAFTVSSQLLQGQSPVLVRLKPSGRDSVRIVRSTRVSLKNTGATLNPAAQEIFGTEQAVVPCRIEKQPNEDVLMTPIEGLPVGEYAVLTTSTSQPVLADSVIRVWDFRVAQ